MKVLILHQHFNTPYEGGAIRSYYLATALVKAGIKVTVITGSNKDKYSVRTVEGIEIHYLPIAYENSYGFVKRSLSFIQYVYKSVQRASKIRNVDLVYAISVPLTVGVAAIRIKKKLGVPFIFEVGDLWPEAPIEMGFIKNPLLKNYLINLERRIYKNANAVVALSPAIEQGILKVYPDATVHQIPNMADTTFFRPEKKSSSLEKAFNVEGKFVVSYIGALGFANGLNNLLDAAKATLRNSLPVHFIICGEGAMRNTLEKSVLNEHLMNVSLYSFRNRDGVAELMNVTDAAFISYLPFKVLETGSPNKYFDALAAGKMIITNFRGWIREEIEENSIGFSFDNNADEFISNLTAFLNSSERIKLAKQRARQLAETKYARKILSERFCRIIQHAVPNGK